MNNQLPTGQVQIVKTAPIPVIKVDVPLAPLKVEQINEILTEFKTLKQMEIEHIELALTKYKNNKSKSAQALGVTLKTLFNKLHAYGLFEKYKA